MNQCCTFWVNGYMFGVDVLDVREIVEYQRSTKVPLSNTTIDGLINLRGEIVTSIDLRKRFPQAKSKPQNDPMSIVVFTKEGPISLVVDEVGDVIDTDSKRIENTQETLHSDVRKLISGVYKMDSQLMLVLDVHAAVDIHNQQRETA